MSLRSTAVLGGLALPTAASAARTYTGLRGTSAYRLGLRVLSARAADANGVAPARVSVPFTLR